MSIKLKPLHEQTIVLTGATSGHGLATAREAARRGASLVLVARNEEALEQIAAELRQTGSRIVTCVADVADEDDVERIFRTTLEEFGGFDTWINNAAAAAFGTMEKLSMEDHRRIFDVNYFGLLKGSLLAARHLREHGGAIINVGSVLSDRSMILQGAYSATKHAVKAATDALRMELAEDNAPVSVTLIMPSAIDTPYPEHARNYMEEPPRLPPLLYDPRLVADAILFAAEHPRRRLYVGFNGYLISLGGRFAPGTMDRIMTLVGRRLQNDPERPPDPSVQDNLYEPREDGSTTGNRSYHVRRKSLWLEAQKNPALPVLAVLGSAAVLRAVISSRRSGRRD